MAKMPHRPLSDSKANRLQGLNQDVLAVAPPAPLPDTDSTPFISPPRQRPVNMSEGGRSGLLWLSLGLALVAALLAVALWLGQRSASRELSELRQQYYQLAAELAEQKSSASAAPLASAGASADMAASVRDDLRQLSAKVRGLTVAVAKLNSADNGDATVALGKRLDGLGTSVKALSSRVATLSQRAPAQAAPQPAVAQPVSRQDDSRLSTLQTRVSKIDKDLQALYRILQGG